jgi:large subunit ribosomal protein L17
MRKRKKGRKLSLKAGQRRALKRSLAEALFLKEKIRTTEAKAKEVSILSEKLITRAKDKNFSNLKYLDKFFSKKIVKKLTEDISKRYAERKGGYTRIIRLGKRKSDGSKMVVIELVG